MSEKFSSIERVIGKKHSDISDEEKQSVFKSTEATFKNQKAYKERLLEKFGSDENIPDEFIKTIFSGREKSPQELKIIDLVNEQTNKLRKKFDLPELNIPPENIYVIPHNADWPKDLKDQGSYFAPLGQFIVIREPAIKQLRESKLVFIKKVLYEMIHFKSYNALKKLENSSSFDAYQIGLHTYKRSDNDESYFGNLNEAVIEELVIIFLNSLIEHPLFKNEFKETAKMKKHFSDQKTSTGKPLINGDEYYINFDQDNSKLWSANITRRQERRILNKLIERVFQKNMDKFKSKEEVFDLFVEAIMTGKIIRLGRLIDKTFGKKTFRKIAELESDVDQQEEFINNL